MNRIKAVIWDWGGVCCSGGEHFSCKRMLDFTALTPDQMSERSRDLEYKLYLGEIGEQEFWNSVISRFKMQQDNFTVEELRQGYYDSYTVYDEVLELIRKTRYGFTHALLSNMGADMSGRIRIEHGANALFNPILFSHEIGIRKPDPKAFLLMLERLNLTAEQTLFIDDIQRNIEAATKLGINTIWFEDRESGVNKVRAFFGLI